MDNFDFNLNEQDISDKIKKYAVVSLAVIILLLILSFILVKISKNKTVNNDNYETITLIKAENTKIKKFPKEETGLSIDNLDINVYNVIDNQNEDTKNLKIQNNNQEIIVKNNKTTIEKIDDKELLSNKIDEITNDDNIKIIKDENVNIKVIPTENKTKAVDYSELKTLNNESLIKNIKSKKHIKPAVKIQILAVKNKDTIEKYWVELKSKYKELFHDKTYFIENIKLNNTVSIYRLQVGMFLDKNDADNFCKKYIKLTNKNKADCIVVK